MKLLIATLSLIPLLFISCATVDDIELTEIESIAFMPEENSKINHSTTFNAAVIAKMKKGRDKDITERKDLIVRSEWLDQPDKRTYTIHERPVLFNDTSFYVQLKLESNIHSIEVYNEIQLNYKGDLNITTNAQDGRSGLDMPERFQTLFGRDGVHGDKGGNGEDGEDGANYTAYLWKEGNELRLQMIDDSTGCSWRYKSISCDTILIDISAGNGGDGGRGGNGGAGKDGKGSKLPGNGGDGGDGGNAGNGGNGGSLILFIHPNAIDFKERIRLMNYGGNPGKPGIPGEGGQSGKKASGQKSALNGSNGNSGDKGKSGVDGPRPVFSVIDFDYSKFE